MGAPDEVLVTLARLPAPDAPLSPLLYAGLKPAGSVVVRAAAPAPRDPKKRVVITGIGCCTVFGNDPDTFYNKCVAKNMGMIRP
jgi:hypothetical protein